MDENIKWDERSIYQNNLVVASAMVDLGTRASMALLEGAGGSAFDGTYGPDENQVQDFVVSRIQTKLDADGY